MPVSRPRHQEWRGGYLSGRLLAQGLHNTRRTTNTSCSLDAHRTATPSHFMRGCLGSRQAVIRRAHLLSKLNICHASGRVYDGEGAGCTRRHPKWVWLLRQLSLEKERNFHQRCALSSRNPSPRGSYGENLTHALACKPEELRASFCALGEPILVLIKIRGVRGLTHVTSFRCWIGQTSPCQLLLISKPRRCTRAARPPLLRTKYTPSSWHPGLEHVITCSVVTPSRAPKTHK